MGNIKEINIKNQTYYFFDEMTNIEDFDPNLLKVDKKLYKNIDIYYTGYITMKDSDYVKIRSVNLLYSIISEVDRYIKVKNGNKCLILDSAELRSTNKSKKVLKKYTELRNGIKNEIEATNGNKEGEYGKDLMKIKFDADDNLPLNKTLKVHNTTIIIRSVFKEDVNFICKFIYTSVCMSYKSRIP